MHRLEQLLNVITDKHIYIQTHNFPDPDAISSAFGLQKLLEAKGITSTICYNGKIDRNSTMQMVECLNIDIVNLEDMENLSGNEQVILVDAQKGNSNIIDMVGQEIACIDHHPTFENVEYPFADIRPEVGSCAAIIADYYFQNNIPIEKDVATGLVFGLRVDTANLSRGVSQLDLDVFYKLYDVCDRRMVKSLVNNTIHCNDLQAYANAINSIRIYDDISIADAGFECPETLIAAVSDFMLALVEIQFAIVYSIRQDGIKLSVRSERNQLDAGKVAYKALKGIGSGGGHQTMAGGFVPFKEFTSENQERVNLMVADIEERFLKCIACRTEQIA